jgi:hypothetical protein
MTADIAGCRIYPALDARQRGIIRGRRDILDYRDDEFTRGSRFRSTHATLEYALVLAIEAHCSPVSNKVRKVLESESIKKMIDFAVKKNVTRRGRGAKAHPAEAGWGRLGRDRVLLSGERSSKTGA